MEMLISVGHFYKNQTRRFILPVVKDYGQELIVRLNKVTKLAVGASDLILPKALDNHIFILVDTTKTTEYFINTLEWIRKQSFYETDYAFDDIQIGYQHMLVIKIPSVHKNMISTLLDSKYSKLYLPNEVQNYFKENDLRFKILTRDVEQTKRFVGWVNKEFDTYFDYEEWDNEVELPVKYENEVFNSHLV
jgi:hypothetical protein